MGCIYKQGRIWWIKYYDRGRPLYVSSRSQERDEAERLLRVLEGRRAEGRPFSPKALRLRFDDLAEDLRKDYAGRGLHTPERLNAALAHLASYFAHRETRDITTDQIREYITRRQRQGAADATINRELSALRRGLNLAVAAEKLWRRPYIPMLREDNVRRGFFEPETFEKVRAELPDYLYPVVTFAYYTGWRKGEILSLRWDQVDLKRGEVRLEPGTTKNREGRTVYLDGELKDIIETLARQRCPHCEYVFCRDGERIQGFKRAWTSACRRAQFAALAAGCEGQQKALRSWESVKETLARAFWKKRAKKQARLVRRISALGFNADGSLALFVPTMVAEAAEYEAIRKTIDAALEAPPHIYPEKGLLFHDFRRTAVRNMVRAGIPERVAMQISGHKTRAIFDRYHIVSESDLREAAWKLAAWNDAVQAEPAGDSYNHGYSGQPHAKPGVRN